VSTDNPIIGKYKLINCIASGQHSQIWEAIDNETSRRVAMKLLLPEARQDGEQMSALKHEFKVGASLDHPNIVKYYEASIRRKQAYFTMGLFAAPNLKTWLFNDLRGIHVRFKKLVEFVCLALDHMHERGWVHRDIKPDNILMSKSAEVRLIDFSLSCGSANILTKAFAPKRATVKGTRTYMAPEQILGKPLTFQTDIYSLGVTLFELLTGQAPFAGSTPNDLLLRHLGEAPPEPSSINTNITPEMDLLIAKMLSKKAKGRHKDVSEFLVEFRNVTVFKEPVLDEAAPTEQQQAEEALKKVLGGALDSRADAMRTKYGITAPHDPAKKAALAAKAKGQTVGARKPTPPPAPPQRAPAPAHPPAMPGMPQPPMPGMPYPMQPMMPGMPMPGMPMPGMPMPAMPAMPMPGMATPTGPTPWVAVPAAGGAGAPWQARPVAPPPVAPGIGRPPAAAIPPVARPAPPPVAPTAVPQVASRPAAPAAPQPPAPPKPVAKKPPPAAAPVGEGIKIDDLLGFDDLPPAV
jgi:serine/threonine-protein kinase